MMKRLLFLLVFAMGQSVYAKHQWLTHQSSTRVGQVMLVHGLNTRPESMLGLAERFQLKGLDVLLVSLAGHHASGPTMKEVRLEDWDRDLLDAWTELVNRKRSLGGKIVLAGHSLGGLLVSDWAKGVQGETADGLILFAPAIKIRGHISLVRPVFGLPRRWVIGSRTPEDYRANRGTSLGAYRALFRLRDRFLRDRGAQALKLKALIFIDPKDELVSFRKLRRFLKKRRLGRWELVPVNNSGHELERSYHHLIFGPKELGRVEWETVVEPRMSSFLQGI